MKGGKYRNPIDKARRDYEYAEKDKKWAALEAGEQIAKIIKERNKLNSIIIEVLPYFNQGLEYIELYDESLQNFAQKKPMIEAAKKAKIPLTTIKAIEYTPVRFNALKYNSDRAGPPLLETLVTVEEVEDEPNMIYAKVENKEPVKIPAEDLKVFLKRLGITKYNLTHVKSKKMKKKMKKNVITEEQRKAELERARQQKSINDETEEYISDEDEKLKQVETTPAKFIIGKTEEQKAAEELADRIEQAKYKQLYEQKEEEKEEEEEDIIPKPLLSDYTIQINKYKEEIRALKKSLKHKRGKVTKFQNQINKIKEQEQDKDIDTVELKKLVENHQLAKRELERQQENLNDKIKELNEYEKKGYSGEGYYYPRFKNKIYRY